jgi:transcriptional regulator with XRE-family HTH domain
MEFARQADVVHPMVVRWLNGENIPNPASAKRIADVLGIPHWTILEMAGHVDTANLGQGGGQRFARQFLAMTAGLPDDQVETILMAVNSLATGLRGAQARRENHTPQVIAV